MAKVASFPLKASSNTEVVDNSHFSDLATDSCNDGFY